MNTLGHIAELPICTDTHVKHVQHVIVADIEIVLKAARTPFLISCAESVFARNVFVLPPTKHLSRKFSLLVDEMRFSQDCANEKYPKSCTSWGNLKFRLMNCRFKMLCILRHPVCMLERLCRSNINLPFGHELFNLQFCFGARRITKVQPTHCKTCRIIVFSYTTLLP